MRSSRPSPAGCPRAAATACSQGWAGCSPSIEAFRFTDDEVDWLVAEGVVGAATAAYLRDFRFTGDLDAYREGDLYFPGSPVLTVTGTLGECVVLETLVLSVLNHDTAIASAAARMTTAAGGRPLVEMGSRRTHEDAAVAVARAAYLAGFASSSNLAAGLLHGVPTVGTAAHAFTLAHASEEAAFRSQVAAQGVGTTLLVDTYDILAGHPDRRARSPVPGSARSGSTAATWPRSRNGARRLLDGLGATGTRIIVTSDLDEYVITALCRRPHRRVRRRHPRRHRLRPPDRRPGLQARRGRARLRDPTRRCARWPRSRPPRSRSAAASTAWRQYDGTGGRRAVSRSAATAPPPPAGRVQVAAVRGRTYGRTTPRSTRSVTSPPHAGHPAARGVDGRRRTAPLQRHPAADHQDRRPTEGAPA